MEKAGKSFKNLRQEVLQAVSLSVLPTPFINHRWKVEKADPDHQVV